MGLVDIMSSNALQVFDQQDRIMHVSLNLTSDFYGIGKVGSTIFIKNNVKKIGGSVAFLETIIFDEEMGLVSVSSHKKMFNKKAPPMKPFMDIRKKYLAKL